MASRKVPVTLISGFTGAGKSTLVERLRRALKTRRPLFLTEQDEDLGALAERLDRAVDLDGADCIVIESRGDSEPFLSAETLSFGTNDFPRSRAARIDTLVTVVDASTFFTEVQEANPVAAGDYSYGDDEETDERTISEILLEQIEFADVIILNKTDLTTAPVLTRTRALIERLNPRARVIATVKAEVPFTEVVGTGLFDFEETDDGAGWLAELDGEFAEGTTPEGISSFTYIEHRPFHAERFNELLGDFEIRGLIRAKGSIWIASRHHEIGVWSLAGKASLLTYGGAWFASTPTRDWPTNEQERLQIMEDWVAPFGDRRQEIAFIGVSLNEREIRARLDACLLKGDEMKDGPESWSALADPLPDWHINEA